MTNDMFIKCSICLGLITVYQTTVVISWTLLVMFVLIEQELWNLPSYIAGTLLLPLREVYHVLTGDHIVCCFTCLRSCSPDCRQSVVVS